MFIFRQSDIWSIDRHQTAICLHRFGNSSLEKAALVSRFSSLKQVALTESFKFASNSVSVKCIIKRTNKLAINRVSRYTLTVTDEQLSVAYFRNSVLTGLAAQAPHRPAADIQHYNDEVYSPEGRMIKAKKEIHYNTPKRHPKN